MRKLTITAVVYIIVGLAVAAQAWDVEYNAGTGLMPTAVSPAWQPGYYGAPVTNTDGLLHIGNSASVGADFRREEAAIDSGVPVTVETRMCVQSATFGSADLGISTYSGELHLAILPDRIIASDRYYDSHTFWQDFSSFHTVRVAYDGIHGANVWVDNQLAMSWEVPDWSLATGYPGGISFGSYSCDSYWQYVRYSKEFEPVPEPSSLLALFGGLAGVGGMIWRRRKS
jgi:hypothetical protein